MSIPPDTIANRHAILEAIKRLADMDVPAEPDRLIAWTYLRGGSVDGWTAVLRRRNGKWCVTSMGPAPFVGADPRIEEDHSSWERLTTKP